ncbi:MAG TPA: GNAT family N-acetyltransferase [Candidatus Acidoferrum sp.]|nr:GNAT family N-acetyltransferase [Candidatus Acidoferrum sp.]
MLRRRLRLPLDLLADHPVAPLASIRSMSDSFDRLSIRIPVIETDRLRLRGHRLDDFPHHRALWADPLVTRFIGGKPLTEEEAWYRHLRYIGQWAFFGFGYWVVEDKSSGEFLGVAGFAENRRDIEPSLKGLMEVGWVLSPQAHGKGLATEAVRAMLDWSDRNFPNTRTACIIDADHTASIRVAEKCGYGDCQRTTYHGGPTLVFFRAPA